MKNGKKEKATRIVLSAISSFLLTKNKALLESSLISKNWLFYYLGFNVSSLHYEENFNYLSSFWAQTEHESVLPGLVNDLRETDQKPILEDRKSYSFDIILKNSNFLVSSGKLVVDDFFFKNLLTNLFFKISPIFNFFIYNVDKNIRKFSRGKSGKYVFLWKYIAPYKRPYLVMKLMAKDSKFYQNKLLKDRLQQALLSLSLGENKNFVIKSKTFSHNYVFKNFKKTLFTTYKTVS